MMDSKGKSQDLENVLLDDASQFRVTYVQRAKSKELGHDKHEEFNKKRSPVCRSGNNAGRVKRVVSCKRKTHHPTVARRKQLTCGRTLDPTNKEKEMKCLQATKQDVMTMDSWDIPQSYNEKSCRSDPEPTSDHCTLTELSKDHNLMTRVLFGRNLRLKVALTLWHRNVGEMLTYFLRIQDTGVFADILPLMSKCIDEESPSMTIGCCVDLFPLVTKVLQTPYEKYLIDGLKWINSVLKHWPEELRASGFGGAAELNFDQNFQVFNQQLLELWDEEPLLKSLPGAAGELAKVVGSFLSQLS